MLLLPSWQKKGESTVLHFFYFLGSGSAAVAARRQRWRQRQHGGGSQLGSRGGSLAEAQFQRQQQRVWKCGSSVVLAAATTRR
jgi:hypothetical protein